MRSSTFIIKGEDPHSKVTDFIRQYHQKAHESTFEGGFLRVYEDYSFLVGNDLVICIRVDMNLMDQGIILIEFIVGGGGTSAIGFNLFARNNSRVNHFRDRLTAFCHAEGFSLEER